MYILSFDTTHPHFSIALSQGNNILASYQEQEASKHAEKLVAETETLLTSHQLKYDDIGTIATTIGPGSFTGVRIGISAAKGFALAKNIPVMGITTLESVLWQSNEKHNTLVTLDARRNEVYAQCFDENKDPISEPLLLPYKDIISIEPKTPYVLTGSGATFVEDYLQNTHSTLNENANATAESICLAAHHTLSSEQGKRAVKPLYIRKPDAVPMKELKK